MRRSELYQPPIMEPYKRPGEVFREVPREQPPRQEELRPSVSFAEARQRSAERKRAELQIGVLSEKAKLLAELSRYDYRTKMLMLAQKERDLMFEQAAFDDSNQANRVDGNYVGNSPDKFKDDDAWEFSLKARKGAIDTIRRELEGVV